MCKTRALSKPNQPGSDIRQQFYAYQTHLINPWKDLRLPRPVTKIDIILLRSNSISTAARAVTLSGGAVVQRCIMGPPFFLYLIFNQAAFLNPEIIDDSSL